MASDDCAWCDPEHPADGKHPMCTFRAGSLWCVNGRSCRNPHHRPLGTDAERTAALTLARAKQAAEHRAYYAKEDHAIQS